LGSAWRRLGAKVSVLEFLDRILFGMDAEIAAEAKKILEKQGLEFHLQTKVTSARVQKGRCIIEREGGPPIECDRVLVAVGRKPNTDDLGLEKVGIKLSPKGQIAVGENFATSVPGIYAVGDFIAGPMLAHKAEEEGMACVEALAGHHARVNYDTIAGVV